MARLLVLAVAALFLASCAGRTSSAGRTGTDASAADPPNGSSGSTPLTVRPVGAGDLASVIRETGARAVLVNVWATWCAPCRQEFPDLMRVHREYRDRGLALVLISTDFEDQMPEVRGFLGHQGVDFPTFIKTGGDMEFIDALSPKWTGAIPATFVYDGQGTLRDFHEGRATYEDFRRPIVELLDAPNAIPKEEGS